MNCIIIEDQPPAQRILKKYIEDIGTLHLKGTFNNATQAIEFLSSNEVNLIFLDIHLPKISGLDFLKILPKRPQVILTTAFSEYALEGYELNVVDYLLKPFSFQRFVQAVTKAAQIGKIGDDTSKPTNRNEVFIKSGYEHIRVDVRDIIYIQADADYTEIFLGKEKHISSEPLRFWVEYLDRNQFVRIHKSFIINISKVTKVAGNQVHISEEKILPIGRAFKDDFIQRFLK
ncbi:MAG: LytTR family DNA-binding domain-containing protein [Cyclobacteriaceae bacterium]